MPRQERLAQNEAYCLADWLANFPYQWAGEKVVVNTEKRIPRTQPLNFQLGAASQHWVFQSAWEFLVNNSASILYLQFIV
jgi:hypothetical protein